MSELEDGAFEIRLGEEPYTATRRNSKLYCYVGELVSRSHAFFQTQPTKANGATPGVYIFHPADAFKDIALHMMNNGFELHLNLNKVDENDEKAYQQFIEQVAEYELGQIGDAIPDGWE